MFIEPDWVLIAQGRFSRYSNGDALPKKNVTSKIRMNMNQLRSKKQSTKKLKYTHIDPFKYDSNGTSRYHELKLKEAIQHDLEHRIKTGQIQFFITLNPNIKTISIDGLKRLVQRWEYRVVERVLKGKQRDIVDNYYALGFIEDGSTHETRHIHLLVHVPKDRLDWFERMAYRMWEKVCVSGSVNVQTVDKGTSNQLAKYVLKDIDYISVDALNQDKKSLDRLCV